MAKSLPIRSWYLEPDRNYFYFFPLAFPKLKENYLLRGKETYSEARERIYYTFQRLTALNLEHKNLLISISVEDFLPDI